MEAILKSLGIRPKKGIYKFPNGHLARIHVPDEVKGNFNPFDDNVLRGLNPNLEAMRAFYEDKINRRYKEVVYASIAKMLKNERTPSHFTLRFFKNKMLPKLRRFSREKPLRLVIGYKGDVKRRTYAAIELVGLEELLEELKPNKDERKAVTDFLSSFNMEVIVPDEIEYYRPAYAFWKVLEKLHSVLKLSFETKVEIPTLPPIEDYLGKNHIINEVDGYHNLKETNNEKYSR